MTDSDTKTRTRDGSAGAKFRENGRLSVQQLTVLRTRRMVLWLFCGVILAAFPIYVDVLRGVHESDLSLSEILRKGEQFVVGGVMALGAAGGILAADMGQENEKTWSLLAALCALCAAVANLIAYVYVPPASSIVAFTIYLGVGALAPSAVCVGMAAGR